MYLSIPRSIKNCPIEEAGKIQPRKKSVRFNDGQKPISWWKPDPRNSAEKVAFSEKVSSCWVCVGFWVRFFPNIFPTFFQQSTDSVRFTIFWATPHPPPPPPPPPKKKKKKKKKQQQHPTLCWKKRWVQSTLFCVLLRSPFLWCTRLCTGLGKVPLNSENPAALIVFPDPNRTPTPRFCTQKNQKKTIRTEISVRQD